MVLVGADRSTIDRMATGDASGVVAGEAVVDGDENDGDDEVHEDALPWPKCER